MQQEQQHVPQPNSFPVFSKDFILKPQLVIDHSNKSKKQMEDFIYAFSKRIETQLTYQKNLNQCSKILEKYIDPTSQKCLSYISSAFKVDNQQRGNQARDLAQSLRTQVVDPMSQSLKNFTNLVKKAEKNFKKLNKDYMYFADNYKRAKQNYYENDNQAKQMIITKNIYKFTSQFSQEKKNKLIGKIMQSIREKMQYQKNYKSSVNQLNEIIQLYEKQGKQMLNELQLAIRQQIKLESDAIRKLIVCEVSMFKNVQYDLINISKQMQKMYGENDIQTFKKQATMISQEDKDKDKDMHLKNVQFDKSLLGLSLKNVEEDYHSWLFSIKKNKTIRLIMQLRMKELNPQIQKKNSFSQINNKQDNKQEDTQKSQQNGEKTQQQKQQKTLQNNQQNISKDIQTQWANLPKQFFNPPPNPNGIYQKITSQESHKDFLSLSEIINNVWVKNQNFVGDIRTNFMKFIQKNHFLRILAYLYIEEYRIQHQVLMNWENYEKAGMLAKTLIQQSQKFGDVFTLKGILALIFTFYSIKDEKTKKLMYQMPAISQCEIWKREDYWQGSIFESTYEQMANLTFQKGETHQQTLLREKNTIFSQLASYCHYMLMLGITSKNVRRIVGRYCRLYEMTENQNKDLSKMITNTTKQIKQLNSPNSPTLPSPSSSIISNNT